MGLLAFGLEAFNRNQASMFLAFGLRVLQALGLKPKPLHPDP